MNFTEYTQSYKYVNINVTKLYIYFYWFLKLFLTSGKLHFKGDWILQMQNHVNPDELNRVKQLINMKYTKQDVNDVVSAMNNNATDKELNLIILRIFGQRITEFYIDEQFVTDTQVFSSDMKMMINTVNDPFFKQYYMGLCNNNIVNTTFFSLIVDKIVSILKKIKDNDVNDILYEHPPAYLSFRFTKKETTLFNKTLRANTLIIYLLGAAAKVTKNMDFVFGNGSTRLCPFRNTILTFLNDVKKNM